MVPSSPAPAGDQTLVFDFSMIGDQDVKDDVYTPLDATLAQAMARLDYGPSAGSVIGDRGFNDFPDEFNLDEWEVAGSLASSIDGDHFVSLTVEPIIGLTVELLSVEFQAWRNGGNSPRDYAVLTSLDGFEAGNELATANVTNSGPANTFTLAAEGTAGLSTADLLEVRLYGWSAGNTSGHTHLNGAQLELRFETLAGMSFTPAGELDVTGDFLHLDGSQLEIGFSGVDNSDPDALQFDVMNVAGDVTLEGDLVLNLLDGYVPQDGDQFTFLAGDSVSGTFSNVTINDADDFDVTIDRGL